MSDSRVIESAVGEPGLTPAGVIETQALTKRYPRGVTALDGLTTVFSPGITGLIGANGAGKSTLLKILLGLVSPTSGRASVLGRDTAVGAERIRTLTGYMPEHDCLPPDVTGTEFVDPSGPDVRAAGHGGPGAGRRVLAPCRAARGAVPADRHLFDRDEAAGQAGPDAGR